MILVPKYRDIIVPVRAQSELRGFYKIEAVKTDGRRRLLADWFPNIITNGGADQLGSNSPQGPLSTCAVGSGNLAPAVTQTSLQTLVASTTTLTGGATRSASGSSPYFGQTTTQYNFPQGTATGNLSEVGVGAGTTALFSRALILDGGGVPTTITVLSTEALYVTYQLRQYAPLADVVSSVTIAGVVYNYTLRAANAINSTWGYVNCDGGDFGPSGAFYAVSNGVLGAITAQPTGSLFAGDSFSMVAYSPGSFTRSGTVTWGITAGNAPGGVTAAFVGFGSRGQYQVGFATAIPKDSSKTLTLSFSHSWVINSP